MNLKTYIILRKTMSLLAMALVLCQISYSRADTINDVSFQALPGDRLQIEIKSDTELQDPLSFTINNPALSLIHI